MNSLLDIVQRGNSYYFDNFGEALVYSLIGFIIVFIGIVLIIAVIWLIGLLMRKTNNLEFLGNIGKKKKQAENPESTAEETIPAASVEEIPDEVKAAIVAAIMAYYEASAPKCEFKVKRIKRI